MTRLRAVAVGAALWPATALAQVPQPPDTIPLLPPITITRVPEPLARAPLAVTILTADALLLADPGLSLATALAAVPGASAQSRYSAARDESLAFRGFGARAAFGIRGVRVLLDGIPQTLPDGQGQLTNVDVRRLDRIEVLRGAASALYGNAAGGVVSLRSTVPSTDRPTADGTTLVGSHGLLLADVGLAVPLGTGFVTGAATRTSVTGYRAQSAYEQWRASARGLVPLGDRSRLRVALHAATLPRAEDPGALTAAEVAADPRQANPGYAAIDADETVTQLQLGTALEREFGRAGQLDAAAFAIRRTLDTRLPFARILLDRWAYGGRAVTTLPLGRATLVVGADLQWQRDDRENRSPTTDATTRDQLEHVREVGPFAQVRVQPDARITLTAGARLDAVTFRVTDGFLADGDDSGARTMAAPSGRLGASVVLAPALVAFAGLGTSFETPTTTELGNRPDGSGGFNPDLVPQHAVMVEAGLRWRVGPAHLEATAFRAAVRDALIPFEVPTDPGRRFFRNAGRTRHQGLEWAATVAPGGGVRLAATYTMADLRFTEFTTEQGTFDGLRVPGVPMHLGRLAAGVTRGSVRGVLELRAASAAWADDANTARADAWWVANANVGVDLPVGATRFRPLLGVENVFDRTYVPVVSVNASAGRYYEPAPRRTVYFGVEVRAR